MAGTAVVYSGQGAQTMVFPTGASQNLAIAVSFVAGFVAFRENRTTRAAIGVAALLLASIAVDSPVAATGAVFVGVVVVLVWPWRLALVALVPPFVTSMVVWLLTKDTTPVIVPSSFSEEWRFAVNLTGRAAGIFGAGNATTGRFVLIVAGVIIGVGIARRRLDRRTVAALVGGLLAAIVLVGSIAATRAGLVGVEGLGVIGSTRYVTNVAVFLAVALLPAVWATVRPASARALRQAIAVAAAGLLAVFLLNFHLIEPSRHFYESWSENDRVAVRQAVWVVTNGCGPGQELKLSARPAPEDPSPSLTVRFVRTLLDRGALNPEFGMAPAPEMLAHICRPARN